MLLCASNDKRCTWSAIFMRACGMHRYCKVKSVSQVTAGIQTMIRGKKKSRSAAPRRFAQEKSSRDSAILQFPAHFVIRKSDIQNNTNPAPCRAQKKSPPGKPGRGAQYGSDVRGCQRSIGSDRSVSGLIGPTGDGVVIRSWFHLSPSTMTWAAAPSSTASIRLWLRYTCKPG